MQKIAKKFLAWFSYLYNFLLFFKFYDDYLYSQDERVKVLFLVLYSKFDMWQYVKFEFKLRESIRWQLTNTSFSLNKTTKKEKLILISLDMTVKSVKGSHVCQLEFDRREMFFYPGENWCVKLFGFIGIIFMISEKNPYCKKYIRSRAYIIYEKRRHIKNYRYRIHPFSLFRFGEKINPNFIYIKLKLIYIWINSSFVWAILMVVTSIIGLAYVPYHGPFKLPVQNQDWCWVKNSLILCSWCDILVNCNTG